RGRSPRNGFPWQSAKYVPSFGRIDQIRRVPPRGDRSPTRYSIAYRRARAASAKRQAKSCGRSEGSSRIALCRIELYIWLKPARAWDKVCFQTDAVGVLEQHRIVTRCPCPLLRAVDYDGPHLSK